MSISDDRWTEYDEDERLSQKVTPSCNNWVHTVGHCSLWSRDLDAGSVWKSTERYDFNLLYNIIVIIYNRERSTVDCGRNSAGRSCPKLLAFLQWHVGRCPLW